jgi:hypothetical protein
METRQGKKENTMLEKVVGRKGNRKRDRKSGY